jgi:hypothetical protein
MRPVGALPVCRANDPRSLRHVTGGDALQASTAVPFDKMAKRVFNWIVSARKPVVRQPKEFTKRQLYAMLAEAVRNTG